MKKGFVAALIASVCVVLALPAFAMATITTPPQAAVSSKGISADVSGATSACRIANDGVVGGWHHNYTDADGDGVCDNYVEGLCNNYGHPGHGHNYVDADGDGVCDNYASGACQNCGHSGYGIASRSGNASGASSTGTPGIGANGSGANGAGGASCYGYVDADGDGVCDNYGNGCGAYSHHGNGAASGSGSASGGSSGYGRHHGGHHR